MVEKYTITKKEEVYTLLKDKRNFSLMDESLLRRLISEMKIVRFTKKTLLIKQDEENRFIYILVKGGVTIYVDKKPLYMLRRTGDVFGELSFATKSHSTASVVAEPDTGVMAMSFKYLKKMNDVAFALWLARVIGDKLIRTSKLKTAEGVVAAEKPKKKQPETKEAPAPDLPKPEQETEILEGQQDRTVEESGASSQDETPNLPSDEVMAETGDDGPDDIALQA